MNLLPLSELARSLICPICRDGDLHETSVPGPGLQCVQCGNTYATDQGVLSFLVSDQLCETNQREIQGNTFTGEDIEIILNKEKWSSLITHQIEWVIEIVDQMLPVQGGDLYALGAGTGFDLRLLLKRRCFSRVFASDISPASTALIGRALAEYPGKLGLFASAFEHCPVPKRPGATGLVFQALHHAADSHVALATLLEHNFDDLIIVEPVTNPPLRVLARFNLVQRVEYTGTRPDWLHLPRIEALACERGYKISSQTWWEIPPYLAPQWLNRHPRVWRSFYQVVDAASRVTNLIRFGSMAAVHFTRE